MLKSIAYTGRILAAAEAAAGTAAACHPEAESARRWKPKIDGATSSEGSCVTVVTRPGGAVGGQRMGFQASGLLLAGGHVDTTQRLSATAWDTMDLPTASMLKVGRDEVHKVTADEFAQERPVGRRERKLQQTRSSLTRSALELFAERGFDAVTVVDIANRSDVDPSTFFRHFRSKESLLFTDMDNYVATIRPLLDERPADEPLIESLRAVSLARGGSYDLELENLRAELTESSAELRAQVVIHRESMAADLAQLIGERLGIDSQTDPRPYLAATVWIAAFEWFRHRKVSTHRRVTNTARAVNDIAEIVQSTGAVFLLSPKSAVGRKKKS